METNEKEKYLEQISHIRHMMETNTKFLSLSGLSGVWAGTVGIVGCFITASIFQDNFLLTKTWNSLQDSWMRPDGHRMIFLVCVAAICILFLRVVSSSPI